MPQMPAGIARSHCEAQDHGLEKALDNRLIELSQPALLRGENVTIEMPIRNINRTVGTMLSSEIAKRYGHEGLPEDTIHLRFAGSAGQSFGAFLAKGVTLDLIGETNDYCGKGLSAGASALASRRASRHRTSLPEMWFCMARLPARPIFAGSPASASQCAILARRRWWRVSATTAANT